MAADNMYVANVDGGDDDDDHDDDQMLMPGRLAMPTCVQP